jgi:hypothetical protein
MAYKSPSFERQLAQYNAAQASQKASLAPPIGREAAQNIRNMTIGHSSATTSNVKQTDKKRQDLENQQATLKFTLFLCFVSALLIAIFFQDVFENVGQFSEAVQIGKAPEAFGDMRHVIDIAAQKTDQVTAQGAAASLQYIEEETKRLDEAAKAFDAQFKK